MQDHADPGFVATAILALWALPILGNVLMIADVRRYIRSRLQRALVLVVQPLSHMPYWTYQKQPSCLKTFGLQLPCTGEELLAAYRHRVKDLHPDRGGDLKKFLLLQRHFEQAQLILQGHANGQPSQKRP